MFHKKHVVAEASQHSFKFFNSCDVALEMLLDILASLFLHEILFLVSLKPMSLFRSIVNMI